MLVLDEQVDGPSLSDRKTKSKYRVF